jgi:hypothetical protein
LALRCAFDFMAMRRFYGGRNGACTHPGMAKPRKGVSQSSKSLTRASRKRIAQGGRDVARGMKDTERRGTPNDIPGGRKK